MNDGMFHIKEIKNHKNPCLDQYHNIDKVEVTKVFHYYAEGYDRVLENLELVTKVANKLAVIQQAWDLSGMMGVVVNNASHIKTVSQNIDSVYSVAVFMSHIIKCSNNEENINEVVNNLDLLNAIKNNMNALLTINSIASAINIVANKKDEIVEVFSKLNKISGVYDDLHNIDVIHSNLAAVIAVAKYIENINSIFENLQIISNINDNIDDIKKISDNLEDLLSLTKLDLANIDEKITALQALLDELQNSGLDLSNYITHEQGDEKYVEKEKVEFMTINEVDQILYKN